VQPRISLMTRTHAIVAGVENHLLCYFPGEDMWYRLGESSSYSIYLAPCHGKLFSFHEGRFLSCRQEMQCYDPFYNCWTSLPYHEKEDVKQIFVSNNDKMYALVSEPSIKPKGVIDDVKCLSYIKQYRPEWDLWECISSFDLGLKVRICIVAKDNFIYFLGGAVRGSYNYLNDAFRYNLCTEE